MGIKSVTNTRIGKYTRRVIKFTSFFMPRECIVYRDTSGYSSDDWFFEDGEPFKHMSFTMIDIDRWLTANKRSNDIEQAITEAILGE